LKKLVLASQSPRRAELLKNAGFEFTVRASSIDETVRPGEDPEQHVERLAWEKADSVVSDPDEIVLAADTIVLIDGEILGKPRDQADAERMLTLLSGRKHEVLTAICLRWGAQVAKETVATNVWFITLSHSQIHDYVATGEPMDKAGAYAIQGIASRYIERIDGSYSNVVGLPIAAVHRLLNHANRPC